MHRTILLSVAMTLALPLAACKQPTGTVVQVPKAAASYEDASGYLPMTQMGEMRDLTVSGTYFHKDTGMAFPEYAGEFKRVQVSAFDANEQHIAVNYQAKSIPRSIVLTAYVFPVWDMSNARLRMANVSQVCGDGYEDAKSKAMLRNKNSREISEDSDPSPRFPDAMLAKSMSYDADGDMISGKDIALRSEVHFYCGIRQVWVVEYRISYVHVVDGASVGRRFMTQLPANATP